MDSNLHFYSSTNIIKHPTSINIECCESCTHRTRNSPNYFGISRGAARRTARRSASRHGCGIGRTEDRARAPSIGASAQSSRLAPGLQAEILPDIACVVPPDLRRRRHLRTTSMSQRPRQRSDIGTVPISGP